MIAESIKRWMYPSETSESLSSHINSLLEEESVQIIHEEMRYAWKTIHHVHYQPIVHR